MSQHALPRQSFNAPEPGRRSTAALKLEAKPASLLQGTVSELPDAIFGWTMRLCGLAVVGLLAMIVWELVASSQLSWHAFGWKFFVQSDWNPVEEQFGALPFIYGTLVSSLLALVIAVPLAVGVAVFITEMCPVGLRGILSFTTELLAAIPSVIYGLWAIFVLVPLLRTYVQPFLATTLGWTGLFTGPPYGIGMLAAGVILSIMIIPIISSITREVLTVVPQHQREAVLALGATRWEMIKGVVLPHSTGGITGAVMLGLGRAMGETIAIALVIGASPQIVTNLFAQGEAMPSVIARNLNEATGDYQAALIGLGVALFVLTIGINIAARALVAHFDRTLKGA
jgi:phosphate transport system permease protein